MGRGAYSKERFYAEACTLEFTSMFTNIHKLEALNLMVSVRSLRPDICTRVNTDNAASAYAIETG